MNVPTTHVYEDVMDILDGKTASDSDAKKRAAAYKAEILGNTSLKSAPEEYWDIGRVLELGISLEEWRSYPIDDKAKIMARQFIKNMVEIIDAYYKDQDKKKEKENGKS